MAFTITPPGPPHAAASVDANVLVGLGAAELPARRFGDVLGGAVRRDALAELRAAFEAADGAARRGESGDGSGAADAAAVL
jgi:hypothetical protein